MQSQSVHNSTGTHPGPIPEVRFVTASLGSRKRKQMSTRLTEQDWLLLKDEIIDLYINKRLPLPKVQAIMQEKHNFTATDRQWKHRIKCWGHSKNIQTHEMQAMIRIRQHQKLDHANPSDVTFILRGAAVDCKKIERYMHEHDIPKDVIYNPGPYASDPSGLEYHIIAAENQAETSTDAQIAPILPDTTDVSWAFETSWQELLNGHQDDPRGYPLRALVEMLIDDATESCVDISVCSLEELLGKVSAGHSCGHRVMPSKNGGQEPIYWEITISRKSYAASMSLIEVFVVRYWEEENKEGDLRQELYLEMRLRLSEADKHYREANADFYIWPKSKGLRTICQLLHGIDDDDALANVDELEKILRAGEATAFSPDYANQFPIAISSYKGQVEMTRTLLRWGSPMWTSPWDFKNFIWVTWGGFADRWRASDAQNRRCSFDQDLKRCQELTSLALRHGARIDECVDPYCSYANILFSIGSASSLLPHQWNQVLQYLLQIGVTMEDRNQEGQTPLLAFVDFAADASVISAFLAAGADLHAKDKIGRGYLHLALSALLRNPVFLKHQPNIMTLLRADTRFNGRPITPKETPLILSLTLSERAWGVWMSVFEEMEWDKEAMESYRYTALCRKRELSLLERLP